MFTLSDQLSQAFPTPAESDGAYIANLWEVPQLCVAIFGVQFGTPHGQYLYEASGIPEEINSALAAAQGDGLLLHNRQLMSQEGPLLFQYWRSYADLDAWARRLPHMRWWRWLLENAGPDVSFYHEIYQISAAEAIFERGCQPVGPAAFVPTSPVTSGEGHSKQRQARFAEAARTSLQLDGDGS